ncbi:methyltransferase domain-containing protein [Acidimicrobiaceae bacterium USS-CC1]|uniref:Methyltransferase domain-containing protein n=1 Tax=Acidiferrimicrobium australe TaxID=2664430 RepID=A0ABW9QYT2_9ACTN|nr:methyltransferase domain-containing protein [Acidiferrimicrobium australe]
MSDPRWEAVDTYLHDALLPADPVLDATLADARAAGLPAIDVSPTQGALLQLLALAVGAERILEIGTLGGYSTIWLARALPPGGRLISLEIDPRHAEVARSNLRRAGLDDRAEVRVAPAADSLRALAASGAEPFDLVFIDADKPSNAGYFAAAMDLTRPGSIVVVDNVIRDGRVADAASTDPAVAGSRRVLEAIGAHPRVRATALQTVGLKGYDGLAIALVRS